MRDNTGAWCEVARSARVHGGDVAVTVAVPFHREPPLELLGDLERSVAANGDGTAVEVVLGSDAAPAEAVRAAATVVRGASVPATLWSSPTNIGRSAIRNRLAEVASGEAVLFLDGDMHAPAALLPTYLEALAGGDVDVAIGGIAVDGTAGAPQRLHHHLSLGLTAPAAERQRDPAKHTYTSNLWVRRSLVLRHPFDEAFVGWGWEDVEWAMRAYDGATVVHLDNPAVHRGLDDVDALVAKYRQSVGNYARLCERHPDAVRHHPMHRLSRLLARAPGAGLLERASERAARDDRLPAGARALALKVFRASLYREVVA